MRYLLDTNIVSDLVRNPQGQVTERIRELGEEQVCTSVIVAAELRYGVAKKGSARLAAQLEAVLRVLDVLAFEPPADTTYGVLRTRLERVGQPIGANDLLIAAHAVALGHTIVTDNEREFSRVESLSCENWLRQPQPEPDSDQAESGGKHEGGSRQGTDEDGGPTPGTRP